MIKRRILTGALAASLVLGLNTTSVFAACESDPSYEWVRLSHEVHHVMLKEVATGGLEAASDPNGLFNASAYTSAFNGKEYRTQLNEDGFAVGFFNPELETDDMFKTAGDNFMSINHLGNAGQAYVGSVKTYWDGEEFDENYRGTARWSADGTTVLGSTCSSYSYCIQNDAVDEQIIADKKVAELVERFKQQSSDPFELAKIVSDYIKDNVTYKVSSKKDSDGFPIHDPDTNTVYGALILGTADCTGYTLTFNEIMNELGIPTMNCIKYTDGTVGHSWNRTRVDGKWYYTDVTFSDTGDGADWLMMTKTEFDSRPFTTVSGSDAHNEAYWSEVCGDIAYSVEFRNDQNYEANELKKAGLFSGDANGFRLADSITRAEMAALLVKVVGATDEVASNSASYGSKCTFADVPNWAKPSVGYCVEKGLINGIGNGLYGSSNKANKLDFCTVLLRALGKSDVQYKSSDATAVDLGYLEYGRAAFADLNRADVVNSVYNAYKKGAIK